MKKIKGNRFFMFGRYTSTYVVNKIVLFLLSANCLYSEILHFYLGLSRNYSKISQGKE